MKDSQELRKKSDVFAFTQANDILIDTETQILPVTVTSMDNQQSLATWFQCHGDKAVNLSNKYGAVLFRGFRQMNPTELETFIVGISGELLAYTNRSTPRSTIQGRIYTSTEDPQHEWIPLHNENSYSHSWPSRLFFSCLIQPAVGGQTPLADSRRILARLPQDLVSRFEKHGVLYVRTFTPGLGLSWQESFQTTDRIKVQKYCAKNGIELQWLGNGRLKTCQRLQATTVHQNTGEHVWFNQAHLFHSSSLGEEVYNSLLNDMPEAELPRHAYLGDGSSIDADDLRIIRNSYDTEMKLFDWQLGDVLMVDNLLTAHGRAPFKGARQIAVAMT